MRLSKASSYGIVAVRYLAVHGKKGPIRTADLAKACGIPADYLTKTLQRLVRLQVLKSDRGRNGGFYLARPPTRTTLLEIIEAVDGPVTGEISIDRKATIPAKARKKVEGLLDDLADYRKSKLKGVTVKQFMG